MISVELFIFGLLIISTLTGLATEAAKKILMENDKTYRANTLAGIIATCLSVAIGVGYLVWTNGNFDLKACVAIIALTFMSWLCAMLGYDKVIQSISQFKTK